MAKESSRNVELCEKTTSNILYKNVPRSGHFNNKIGTPSGNIF